MTITLRIPIALMVLTWFGSGLCLACVYAWSVRDWDEDSLWIAFGAFVLPPILGVIFLLQSMQRWGAAHRARLAARQREEARQLKEADRLLQAEGLPI